VAILEGVVERFPVGTREVTPPGMGARLREWGRVFARGSCHEQWQAARRRIDGSPAAGSIG